MTITQLDPTTRARSPRRRVLTRSLAAAGALLLVGAATAAAAGTNGSFEDGDAVPPGIFLELSEGSTAITGWDVTGTVDYIGTYWQASDGDRSIDLNGTSEGAVSQTFATLVGATYAVTFDLSGNPDNPPGRQLVKTGEVSATGTVPQAFSYDIGAKGTTRGDMNYELQGYVFKATSTSTTLTFASTMTGSTGPVIDNVVVTETLPTAAECKKGGWETMTDTAGLPFKNQGDCVSHFATDLRNPGDG